MASLFNEFERTVLIDVAAAPETPGTIVHDFTALLDMMGDEGLPISPKLSEFAMAVVPKINALLAEPAHIDVPCARQSLYPHVGALHLLLRASKIGRVDRSQSTPRFKCHPVMIERWRALNQTERYFALLEDWWCFHIDNDQWNPFLPDQRADWRADMLRQLTKPGKAGKPTRDYKEYPKSIEPHLLHLGKIELALLQMFGMLEIKQADLQVGAGWTIRQMHPILWGTVICTSYSKVAGYPGSAAEMLRTPAQDDVPLFHIWADQLSPLFPQWQSGLGEVPEDTSTPGAITVKVVLDKNVWRRLALPGEQTFADLAAAILAAFDFDDEHLYGFTYKDDYGARKVIDDHHCDDAIGEFADTVRLADVILAPKMRIEFDYDTWRFVISTEKINAECSVSEATLVDSAGKAPEQYSRSD